MDRLSFDQLAFNETQTDLENGKVSAIIAVDYGPALLMNGCAPVETVQVIAIRFHSQNTHEPILFGSKQTQCQ
jgi:hypothetical protein